MKIKTIIYLSLFVLTTIVLLFSLVLWKSTQDVSLASDKHAKANALTKSITEMRALSLDYIVSPGERAKRQWEINAKEITGLLSVYPNPTPKEQALLSDIQTTHQELQDTFAALLDESAPTSENIPDTISHEVQNRLVGQLLTESQGIVTDSIKLSEITYKQTIATQAMANMFIVFIIVVLLLICLVYFYLFKRKILQPLSRLEEATRIISSGNLSYVIPVDGHDEINILAKSFNTMTEKLQELDSMKSEFLKVAAHQLRTPLGIMRWNLESMLDKSHILGKKDKKALQEIYSTVIRLITLIGELMVVYRIDQRADTSVATQFNVKESIKENIQVAEKIAKDMHIQFDAHLDIPDTLTITMNKEKFQTILQNIFSNALQYNKTDGGKVEIATSRKGKGLQIVISDTGIGIPKKELPHIFTRFFRASNGILAQPNGNGLGLYVVKSYVEAMGGSVHLESEENKGTTLTILLPKTI